MNLEHIFLLGHRAQHGKNEVGVILEQVLYGKKITKQTFFAELLKKQVAERYGLDAEQMEFDEYKQWCPPWVNPIKKDINSSLVKEWKTEGEQHMGLIGGEWRNIVSTGGGYSGNVVVYESPRTVREILIKEGCLAREIWGDTWANSSYQKLFNSEAEIGIITDYRFPNEFACFDQSFKSFNKDGNLVKPKVHRVLVHRPTGKFNNDGADNELPDLEDENAWDYIIMNDIEGNGWKDYLKSQIVDMLKKIEI